MTAPAAINLRLARQEDAHEIALMSRCLVEIGLRGWFWYPERVAKAIQLRDSCVVVAEVKKCIAGFAIAEFGDTKMHLSLLAVSGTHQRRGIGRRLMEWLEQSALTAGITLVELELRTNNFGARCFYHALGFRDKRYVPDYYRGQESALKMAREIRAVQPSSAN
jgi:ribosomal protein S18 acetylase RimI-like enzyme